MIKSLSNEGKFQGQPSEVQSGLASIGPGLILAPTLLVGSVCSFTMLLCSESIFPPQEKNRKRKKNRKKSKQTNKKENKTKSKQWHLISFVIEFNLSSPRSLVEDLFSYESSSSY